MRGPIGPGGALLLEMAGGFDFVAHGGRYVVSVVKGRMSLEDADSPRKEMTLLGSRNATAENFDSVVASPLAPTCYQPRQPAAWPRAVPPLA